MELANLPTIPVQYSIGVGIAFCRGSLSMDLDSVGLYSFYDLAPPVPDLREKSFYI